MFFFKKVKPTINKTISVFLSKLGLKIVLVEIHNTYHTTGLLFYIFRCRKRGPVMFHRPFGVVFFFSIILSADLCPFGLTEVAMVRRPI